MRPLCLIVSGCLVACAATSEPSRSTLPPGNDPVSRAARADEILGEIADKARGNRYMGVVIYGLQGVLYGGIGTAALVKRDETDDPDETAAFAGIALGIGVALTAIAIYMAASPTDEETLHESFLARARVDSKPALVAAERELAALADKRHGQRNIIRTVGLVVFAAGVGGIIAGARADENAALGLGIVGVLLGGVAALASLAELPAEEAYAKWRVELGTTTTATGSHVPALGVIGRF